MTRRSICVYKGETYNICILYVVKVILILISKRAQIRKYALAWKTFNTPPCKGPISVEENQGILDLEDV